MKERLIVDTSVLVAGLLTRDPTSPTAWFVDEMLKGRLLYLLSPALLEEYRRVLLRPKIRRLHALDENEVDELLTELVSNALWRDQTATIAPIAPDPGDTHLWALLHEDPLALLVTCDQLLITEAIDPLRVFSPRAFLTRREAETLR
jgi:putative PIN family toxin of toxin-antitoxin system